MTPNGSPAHRPWTPPLFIFILILAVIEVVAFVVFDRQALPRDAGALLDRYFRGDHSSEIFEALRAQPANELIPKLDSVMSALAPEKTKEAYQLAIVLRVFPHLPPETQVRIMRAVVKLPKEPREVSHMPLGDFQKAQGEFAEAVERSSAAVRRGLLDDLLANKIEPLEMYLVTPALARTADPEMIVAMHRHLVSAENPVNAWHVLTAFAARTDLPLTKDEDLWPLYRKHLGEILDPVSKEVRWSAAVALARELPDSGGSPWELDKGCGVLPPPNVPMEALHPRVIAPPDVTWPMDDEAAANLERRLSDSWRKEDPYAIALLLYWRRTGRLTLPYYPYDAEPPRQVNSGEELLWRPRRQAQARQILDRNHFPSNIPWTCFIVGTGPRTEPGRLIASASGVGRVRCTMTADLPGSSETSPFRLGVRTEPQGPGQDRHDSNLSVVVEARFERQEDGGFNIEGSHHADLGSGGSGGGLQGYVQPGEATILRIIDSSGASSSGATNAEERQKAFTLLIPEVQKNADLEVEWKRAVGRYLERWAVAPEDALRGKPFGRRDYWDYHLGQMLSLTSWVPIEEARAPLQKLWKRREFLKGQSEFDDKAPTNANTVGLSLLLLGDEAPLADPECVAAAPESLALRIFLFTPSGKVKAAVEERAAKGVSDPIAREVMLKVGAAPSSVADRARSADAKYILESIPEYALMLLLVLGLVAAMCLPRAPGNQEARAASFVGVGLAFQFLTLQIGSRVWMPFAGDLCFMAAATIQRRRALQALTGLLAAVGLTSFVAPGTEWTGVAGRLLFAIYLGWLSLSQMSQPRRGVVESVAHVATWILLIVPLTVGAITDFFNPGGFDPPVIRLQGAWAWLYVGAMFLSPFVIVYAWRRRAFPRDEQSSPQVATS
jgi:hypothetical protein